MNIIVSSKSLGTPKHLLFDGKMYSWIEDINSIDNPVLFGFDSYRDIREALYMINVKFPKIEDTPWGVAQRQVSKDISDTPWIKCIPRQCWRKFSKNLVECIWLSLNDDTNSYYIKFHVRNRKIIEGLQRAYINRSEICRISKSLSPALKENVGRFLPQHGDIAPVSRYSLSNTVTGRMTIVDGPNILTLKKDFRNILKSRYKNGKIIEIDIQSAEPRLVLSLFGKKVDGDIYKEVSRSISEKISRDAAKIATLSALYGASHHTLRSQLPKDVDSLKVLEMVRDYFGVDILEKMITDQHSELGYIVNTHGRKVFSKEPSVNHLVQSSAVDVSFDIFESILNSFSENNIKFEPIYIIHDAIIIDLNLESVKDVYDICENGFESKKIKTKFPVKIKEIN
jgi:hypothetical protein